MTKLLERAFTEASKLPDAEQDEVASIVLREIADRPVPPEAPTSHKPIWEVADEIRKSVPETEWAKLPTDGAAQHDHYLYGTPKRSTS